MELNKRGNSFLGMLLGVVPIVGGIVVGIVTVAGFLSHFLPSEIASAALTYIIGIVAGSVLVALGLLICWVSSK